jgi:hypothetical protein
MEADWEFEMGGDAPVIEAHWPGFVDLRDRPSRVGEIAEIVALPGLEEALLRLNRGGSPVWTCKTDVFVPDQVDPDELASSKDEAQFVIACYIDMLMRSDQVWRVPAGAERDCRRFCAGLREIRLRCCRVDLVIRRARAGEGTAMGVTVYFSACGRTEMEAKARLGECLTAFVELVVPVAEASGDRSAGFRK